MENAAQCLPLSLRDCYDIITESEMISLATPRSGISISTLQRRWPSCWLRSHKKFHQRMRHIRRLLPLTRRFENIRLSYTTYIRSDVIYRHHSSSADRIVSETDGHKWGLAFKFVITSTRKESFDSVRTSHSRVYTWHDQHPWLTSM